MSHEICVCLLHFYTIFIKIRTKLYFRERSGSVVECLTRGCGFEPHGRHCVMSLSKNINPSLVLVQLRKTRPYIPERLSMGRKESNQTNKTKLYLRYITIVIITYNVIFVGSLTYMNRINFVLSRGENL